jgi:hypothetical protein
MCMIELAQPAAAKLTKGSKGRVSSWGSSLKQGCAARLQRMDAFFTQHNLSCQAGHACACGSVLD